MKMKVVNNIMQYRQRAELSQKELALIIGCNMKMISHWETGKRTPSLENGMKLAEALDVPIDILFQLVNER